MLLSLAISALLSCNPDTDHPLVGTRSACDPLDTAVCALPYPSSFYLSPAATETGFQVDFAPTTLPKNRDQAQVAPTYWNEKDGFPTHGPFLAYFQDLALDGVVGHSNLADYAAADAKVVLLDVATGERVPAWAEIDLSAEDPAQRMLMIWPAQQLQHAHTYVVALRGLVDAAGQPVASSEAFAALRDGVETESYDVEFRRDHFEDTVFGPLTAAGIDRAGLNLAWDFTTVSRASSLGRMEKIRDEGLALVDAGIAWSIEDRQDFDCATGDIAREFTLSAELPNYMMSELPGTVLTRDAQGMPFVNGTMEAEYLVRVPCSVAEGARPARVVNYGHGQLGSSDEAGAGWLAAWANREGFVIFAHTWYGMSYADVPSLSLALAQDPTLFVYLPERLHQGYFSAMAGVRLMQGPVASDVALRFPDANGDLQSVIDPDGFGYYGISQGGILGGSLVAMSPDLDRGVLGVPGAPYPLLLWRSRNFEQFFRIFREKFDDHRDISLMIALFGALWEPTESAGWLNDLAADPSKRILMQPAIGDPEVSTLGAHVMARSIGAVSLAPQARPVFAVPETAGPVEGNVLVEFRYDDIPPEQSEPVTNLPQWELPDPHGCPRKDPEGQAMVAEFLRTGVVTQTCDGACGGESAATCD